MIANECLLSLLYLKNELSECINNERSFFYMNKLE